MLNVSFPLRAKIICCWLFLRINVDLAIFQPYLDLEAGDNQSLKIQVARPGIELRSSCSASQELNHSATAAPKDYMKSASCEYRKMSARRGAQFVPIGMPTVCWKTFPAKTTKILSTRNSSILMMSSSEYLLLESECSFTKYVGGCLYKSGC